MTSDHDSKQPQFSDSVVAFMDLMGTKQAFHEATTKKNPFGETAPRFGVLAGCVAEIRFGMAAPTAIQVSMFSDCIAISSEVQTEQDSRSAEAVIEQAIRIFDRLLRENQVIARGAIVRGKLYHQSGILFGPAMNAAATEEKNALLPRLVLSAEVVRLAAGGAYSAQLEACCERWNIRCEHGVYFYDPLLRDQDGEKRRALRSVANELLQAEQGDLKAKGLYLMDQVERPRVKR